MQKLKNQIADSTKAGRHRRNVLRIQVAILAWLVEFLGFFLIFLGFFVLGHENKN
jgi:hypothetical protein